MSIAEAVENRHEEPKAAFLMILNSKNGTTDWTPVKPEDVPAWLQEPQVMGNLVHGNMATHPTEKTGWFRAEHVALEQNQ